MPRYMLRPIYTLGHACTLHSGIYYFSIVAQCMFETVSPKAVGYNPLYNNFRCRQFV